MIRVAILALLLSGCTLTLGPATSRQDRLEGWLSDQALIGAYLDSERQNLIANLLTARGLLATQGQVSGQQVGPICPAPQRWSRRR